MKLLNWNIKRLEEDKEGLKITSVLDSYNADIVVLTETSSKIILGVDYNHLSTNSLDLGYDGIQYKNHENRVSIFTKYPILSQHETYDPFTSICCDIDSPEGILTVYGTIIGTFGGIGDRFKSDL